jgi:hypothetical protein
VHDRPEWDISEVGRGSVIAHHAVGQHGERVRIVEAEDANALYADTATSVGVIYEDEFTPIGVGFFDRGELAVLGTKRNGNLFLVLGTWFFVGGVGANAQQTKNNEQRTTNQEHH